MATDKSSSDLAALHPYGDLGSVIEIDTKQLFSADRSTSSFNIPSNGNGYSSRNFNDLGTLDTEPFSLFQDALQDVITQSPALSGLLDRTVGLTATVNIAARAELEVVDELRLQAIEKGSEVLGEAQSVLTQATRQVRDGVVKQVQEFADSHPESVHELENLKHQIVERADDLTNNMGQAVKSGLSSTYRGLKNLYGFVVEVETKLGLLPSSESEMADSGFQAKDAVYSQGGLEPQMQAWSRESPMSGVMTTSPKEPLIGLIDSGFNVDSLDIDRDRLILGQDRIGQDSNPLLDAGEHGEHGTAMLGIIGATQHNGIGIDGINDKSSIWLGRALGSGKVAASITEFVDYSKKAGYENAVLNLSMDLTQINPNGTVSTRTRLTGQEREAIFYAQQNHVIVVVAAGNNGGAISSWSHAAQEFDNVVLVGAADGGNRAAYSDAGIGLSIVAPGGTVDNPVMSTSGDNTAGFAGTSIAAARVTGAISRVQEANGGLNYRQVIDVLKNTAQDLDTPGYDTQTGNGLLNAEDAITLAQVTQAAALVESAPADLARETWLSLNGAQASEREADFFSDIGDSFKKAADDTIHGAQSVANNIVEAAKPVVESISNTAQDVGNNISNAASPIVESISNMAQDFGQSISEATTPIVESISNTAQDAGQRISETTTSAVESISDTAQNVGHNISDAAMPIVESISHTAQDVGQSIATITQPTVENISNTAQNVGNNVSNVATPVLENISITAQDFVQSVSDSAMPVMQSVFNTAHDVGNNISDAAMPIIENISNTAQAVEQNVVATITSAVEDVSNTTQDIGNNISDAATNVVNTAQDVGERLSDTAQDAMDYSTQALEHQFDNANHAMSNLGHNVFEHIRGSSERIFQGFNNGLENVQKERPNLELNDWSGTRKVIREFGTVLDKEWDKTKPYLGTLGDQIDVSIGAAKAVLEMADGIFTITDFAATHSPKYYLARPDKLIQDVLQANQSIQYLHQQVDKGIDYAYQNPEIGLVIAWEIGSGGVQRKIVGSVLQALWEPYSDALRNGHPGQAIGRGIVDVGSLFIGAGAFGKAGKSAGVAGKTVKTGELIEVAVKPAIEGGSLIDDAAKNLPGLIDDSAKKIIQAEKPLKQPRVSGKVENVDYGSIRSNKKWDGIEPSPSGDISDPTIRKAAGHYERILKKTDDVAQIASQYALDPVDIARAKNHVFEEIPHYKNFEPDIEIVNGWERLSSGNANKADEILLHHEIMESRLVSEGVALAEAHKIAEARYNWAELVRHLPMR
jgi:phage-related protein